MNFSVICSIIVHSKAKFSLFFFVLSPQCDAIDYARAPAWLSCFWLLWRSALQKTYRIPVEKKNPSFPPRHLFPFSPSVTTHFKIIKCLFRENCSIVSLRHFMCDVTVSCHGVICRHLSHMRNAERREKLYRERDRGGGFPVSNPRWFFPPRPGGLFSNTATLNTLRVRDIIGNWAPGQHSVNTQESRGRMWLKLWSTVADMLERNVGWTCTEWLLFVPRGPAWGHNLSLSCKGTVMVLIHVSHSEQVLKVCVAMTWNARFVLIQGVCGVVKSIKKP